MSATESAQNRKGTPQRRWRKSLEHFREIVPAAEKKREPVPCADYLSTIWGCPLRGQGRPVVSRAVQIAPASCAPWAAMSSRSRTPSAVGKSSPDPREIVELFLAGTFQPSMLALPHGTTNAWHGGLRQFASQPLELGVTTLRHQHRRGLGGLPLLPPGAAGKPSPNRGPGIDGSPTWASRDPASTWTSSSRGPAALGCEELVGHKLSGPAGLQAAAGTGASPERRGLSARRRSDGAGIS